MREYIESWKVLLVAIQWLFLGGVIFAPKKRKVRDVSFVIVIAIGIALMVLS